MNKAWKEAKDGKLARIRERLFPKKKKLLDVVCRKINFLPDRIYKAAGFEVMRFPTVKNASRWWGLVLEAGHKPEMIHNIHSFGRSKFPFRIIVL